MVPHAGDGRSIQSWNRLIANAPTYDVLLELLARLLESQALPNVDTLNALVDRSPTFDEAMRWIADLDRYGVKPDVVTYNALIRRAPDFESAIGFLEVMDEAGVAPTPATLPRDSRIPLTCVPCGCPAAALPGPDWRPLPSGQQSGRQKMPPPSSQSPLQKHSS